MTNYNERLDKVLERLYRIAADTELAADRFDPYSFNGVSEAKQAITSLTKELALEARIDELEHTFVSYDNALANELVENPEWEYGQVVERIAELKAQQEEV